MERAAGLKGLFFDWDSIYASVHSPDPFVKGRRAHKAAIEELFERNGSHGDTGACRRMMRPQEDEAIEEEAFEARERKRTCVRGLRKATRDQACQGEERRDEVELAPVEEDGRRRYRRRRRTHNPPSLSILSSFKLKLQASIEVGKRCSGHIELRRQIVQRAGLEVPAHVYPASF